MSESLSEMLARIGDETYENRDGPDLRETKVTRGHDPDEDVASA